MARVFAADRKHDLVIECLEKALKIDPYYAASWNNLGIEYSEIGNNENAIKCYKKSIQLNPDKAITWNNLRIEYYIVEDYERAEMCYKKAVELDLERAVNTKKKREYNDDKSYFI